MPVCDHLFSNVQGLYSNKTNEAVLEIYLDFCHLSFGYLVNELMVKLTSCGMNVISYFTSVFSTNRERTHFSLLMG